MRLIDADKLKEELKDIMQKQSGKEKDLVIVGELFGFIDNQETAFDISLALEEIGKRMFTADLYEHGWKGQTVRNLICYGDVAEILCEQQEN